MITADLTIGVAHNRHQSNHWRAYEGITLIDGVKLHGAGFDSYACRKQNIWALGKRADLQSYSQHIAMAAISPIGHARRMVIDLFGLGIDEVRQRFPEVYQHRPRLK